MTRAATDKLARPNVYAPYPQTYQPVDEYGPADSASYSSEHANIAYYPPPLSVDVKSSASPSSWQPPVPLQDPQQHNPHAHVEARPPPSPPQASGSRSASSPKARVARNAARAPAKSKRQQYASCGGCRLRRVKCDLKDLPRPPDGASWQARPKCAECVKRQILCVDENLKKPKNKTRRGRRLQQAELIYGHDPGPSESSSQPSANSLASRPPSIIPALQLTFFDSAFFQRFHVQHPLVDPADFKSRFEASLNGNRDALGDAGELIAKIFVIWAASYGVDNFGIAQPIMREDACARVQYCNAMVDEVLKEVDERRLWQRPSWDHVRVVLLLLPLAQDVLEARERRFMYETAVRQVYELFSSGDSTHPSDTDNISHRLGLLRVWWYTFIHEGVTSGLRGDTLVIDEELFDGLHPPSPTYQSHVVHSPTSPGSSPSSHYSGPSFSSQPPHFSAIPATSRSLVLASAPELHHTTSYRYARVPIMVSVACRVIHSTLTGPKAYRRQVLDEDAVKGIWEMIEQSTEQFEELRAAAKIGVVGEYTGAHAVVPGGELRNDVAKMRIILESTERFVSAWEIFMAECHDTVRTALAARLKRLQDSSAAHAGGSTGTVDEHAAQWKHAELDKLTRLLAIADRKCDLVAQHIAAMLPALIDSDFFKFDASAVGDGVFLAGRILASQPGTDREVQLCLTALGQMRWAYARSTEREDKLKELWQCFRRQEVSPQSVHANSNGVPAESSIARNGPAYWGTVLQTYGDHVYTASPHSYVELHDPRQPSAYPALPLPLHTHDASTRTMRSDSSSDYPRPPAQSGASVLGAVGQPSPQYTHAYFAYPGSETKIEEISPQGSWTPSDVSAPYGCTASEQPTHFSSPHSLSASPSFPLPGMDPTSRSSVPPSDDCPPTTYHAERSYATTWNGVAPTPPATGPFALHPAPQGHLGEHSSQWLQRDDYSAGDVSYGIPAAPGPITAPQIQTGETYAYPPIYVLNDPYEDQGYYNPHN